MHTVEFTPAATRAYAAADRPLAKKIARCIEQLERDPRGSNNAEPMVGPDAGKWRYRIGDRRVIYTIDDARQVVTIIDIAPRGSVYR